MASDILPVSPLATNPDPFTASDELLADESYIVWLDSVRQAREAEDREAYERWCDEEETARLQAIEEWERIGNDYSHEEA